VAGTSDGNLKEVGDQLLVGALCHHQQSHLPPHQTPVNTALPPPRGSHGGPTWFTWLGNPASFQSPFHPCLVPACTSFRTLLTSAHFQPLCCRVPRPKGPSTGVSSKGLRTLPGPRASCHMSSFALPPPSSMVLICPLSARYWMATACYSTYPNFKVACCGRASSRKHMP
jgi:hypothetical protein